MAKTAFATNNALTKKLWEEKLFRDTLKESYFSRFMGENENSIVQVKTQLEKSKGDNITFGLVARLNEMGFVTSGEAAEGNEQSLTTYSDSVSIEEYVIAVRDRGPLDRQRAMFMIDEVSQERLKGAMAELIDRMCFANVTGSSILDPEGKFGVEASSKIFYKTSSGLTSTATYATARTALTAADSKLTPSMLNQIAAWARTGGNRGQTPLRPIKVDGREYYVLVVHPDVMADLYEDSTFAQAMREAEVRGKDNPLFHGSKAIWRNVVVHEHEVVPIAADAGAGSNVPFAHCALMGAQSLCWAWGARPEVVAEQFDYKREHGYASKMMAGCLKPRFNSKDYGVVSVLVSRTNVAGL